MTTFTKPQATDPQNNPSHSQLHRDEIAAINALEELDSEKLAIASKAIGSEINTGTDNDKYVTSKSIADSKISFTDGVETLTNKTLTLPTFTNGTINFNAPQGFLINGKIVRTVDENGDMTVAIKTLAGNDPSATDPVYCRIGNTVRSITSALEYTFAAGINWFNAGSAELATKEIDYFASLIWNTSASTVQLCASRKPMRVFGDSTYNFSSENLLYGTNALSNAVATDEVELIGRFNATLSAGPTYTWSIPATDIIINGYENSSEFHTWNLTLSGGTTTPTFVINNNRYKIVGNRCIGSIVLCNTSGGTAGSGSGELVLKLPFSAKSFNYLNDGIGYYFSNNVSIPISLTDRSDLGTDCFVLNNMGRNVISSSTFNGADRGIYINFDYEI